MVYLLDGNEYNVEIIKKGNKNTYIRVKDDLTILVTTNYSASKSNIRTLLDRNRSFLINTIKKKKKQLKKESQFILFGVRYKIVVSKSFTKVKIIDGKVYVSSKSALDKWLKKEIVKVFEKRLKYNYDLFKENIPFPSLKVRAMKTRWGVCNRETKTITLNSNLIKETIDKIDYVIIHELSHFLEFNHSVDFWDIVSEYCPDYRTIRKELRE